MQKHISLAGTALTAHISKNPTSDINSQHPYLLGFDSNLIPNLNILLFQPYPGEDSEYSEESEEIRMTIQCISSWECPEYLGNSLRLVLFLTGYSRVSLQNTEYTEYSLDPSRKTQIIEKVIVLFFRVHYRRRIHRVFAGFIKKYLNNRENHQKEQ